MNATVKNQLSNLMKQAWQLVKKYGFTMADAMKRAWSIVKLRAEMHKGIVKFMYTKLDGTIRTAWGTLNEANGAIVSGNNNRKGNDSVTTYFDTEKGAWRCFKTANFIGIA